MSKHKELNICQNTVTLIIKKILIVLIEPASFVPRHACQIRPLVQAYTISLSLNLQHSSSKLQYNIEPKLVPNFKTLQIYRDSYLCCFWTDLHKSNINIHT